MIIYNLLEGLYPSLHEQAHHVFAHSATCLLIETLLSRDFTSLATSVPRKGHQPPTATWCSKIRHGCVALTVMGMWHVGLLLPALVQAATPVNSGVAWKDFSVKKFFQKCLKDKSIHFGWRQPYYIPLLFSTILGKRVTSVLAGPKVNMILQGVQWWMLTSVGHAPFTMGFAGAAGNLERFWSATCWRFSYVFPGAWGPYVGSLRKMKMKQTSQTWRLIICLLISWDLTYLMKIEVGVCFAAAWWTFCGCFG